jgi:hypothetical protein
MKGICFLLYHLLSCRIMSAAQPKTLLSSVNVSVTVSLLVAVTVIVTTVTDIILKLSRRLPTIPVSLVTRSQQGG